MVLALHLIWTAYGWWLPNDPRGSNSHEIRVEQIADLGQVHRGRKRVQPAGVVIREFYTAAADRSKRPLLTFDKSQFPVIANAFAAVIAERSYICHACAIMPDHVHLLIRRHRDWAEEMIDRLQQRSRQAAIDVGLRAANHPVWGGRGGKVFLNSPPRIHQTISYIRRNPIQARLPAQD